MNNSMIESQLAELSTLWNAGYQTLVLNTLESLCAENDDALLIKTTVNYNLLARRYPRADYFKKLGKKIYPNDTDFKDSVTYIVADPFMPKTYIKAMQSELMAA